MVPFRLEFLENSNNVFFFDQIPTEKVEVDGDDSTFPKIFSRDKIGLFWVDINTGLGTFILLL